MLIVIVIVIVLVILLNLLAESKLHQFFLLQRKIIKIKKFAKTLMIFTNSRDVMMTSFIFNDGTRIIRHLGFTILNIKSISFLKEQNAHF